MHGCNCDHSTGNSNEDSWDARIHPVVENSQADRSASWCRSLETPYHCMYWWTSLSRRRWSYDSGLYAVPPSRSTFCQIYCIHSVLCLQCYRTKASVQILLVKRRIIKTAVKCITLILRSNAAFSYSLQHRCPQDVKSRYRDRTETSRNGYSKWLTMTLSARVSCSIIRVGYLYIQIRSTPRCKGFIFLWRLRHRCWKFYDY